MIVVNSRREGRPQLEHNAVKLVLLASVEKETGNLLLLLLVGEELAKVSIGELEKNAWQH